MKQVSEAKIRNIVRTLEDWLAELGDEDAEETDSGPEEGVLPLFGSRGEGRPAGETTLLPESLAKKDAAKKEKASR